MMQYTYFPRVPGVLDGERSAVSGSGPPGGSLRGLVLTGDGTAAFRPGCGDLSPLFDFAVPGFLEGAIRGVLLALSAGLS
jgi:hypothetical protein